MENTLIEAWLPVVGFEGLYEVSSLGNIKKIRSLKQTRSTKTGRPLIQLWKNGKGKMFSPHQLVLWAFVGPPADGQIGLHNDGNPWNNQSDNLRWGTKKDNYADAVSHGTLGRGDLCPRARLTEHQARAILADDRKYKEIAVEYGVCHSTVSHIKNGRNWSHLQEP